MIVIMDSKVFMKNFVANESDDTILEAIYLIASDRIRYTKRYEDSCMRAPFKPTTTVIREMTKDAMDEKEMNLEYIRAYHKYLSQECSGFMATVLMEAEAHTDRTFIILTTKVESRTLLFPKYLQQWIFNEFEIAIPIYTKNTRLSDFIDFRLSEETKSRIAKVLRKEKKHEEQRALTGDSKRKFAYLKGLSKKELRKLLRRAGIYDEGSSKQDMLEDAMQYL